MRNLLVLAALVVATPAAAQVTANLPVTCNTAGTICGAATSVTNPDGSNVGVGSVAGPSVVRTEGAATIATGQISAGTTSTLIAAARTGRQRITVTVTTAVACSFGNTGVAAGTGFPLQAVAGATLTIDTSAALYGVCTVPATVGYIEAY